MTVVVSVDKNRRMHIVPSYLGTWKALVECRGQVCRWSWQKDWAYPTAEGSTPEEAEANLRLKIQLVNEQHRHEAQNSIVRPL